MRAILTATVAACAFLAAVPAFAHHSIAGYYFTDQRATIEGTLTQFDFRSPHSFVELEAADPKTGETVKWAVEWNSASRLSREGIVKETLKPGDHVIIIGQPSRKADEHRLHMVRITRPSDGWSWGRGSI